MVGDNIYLPEIALNDGATLGSGFSTTPFNLNTFASIAFSGSTIPYFFVSLADTSKVPTTDPPYLSYTSINSLIAGLALLNKSSPNNTANGSFPTKVSACKIA